jgi:hypothetical protein
VRNLPPVPVVRLGLSGKSKTLPHLGLPHGFGNFKIQ